MSDTHQPFCGDHFVFERIAELKDRHGLITAVETGSFHGATAAQLADIFDLVHTIEINAEHYYAGEHLNQFSNLRRHCGHSRMVLRNLVKNVPQPVLFYLDSHGLNDWPLRNELMTIANSGIERPVIAIHDAQVPNSDLGFYEHHGTVLNEDYVSDLLDDIYGGPGEYVVSHNDSTHSAGERRGMLYVEPTTCAAKSHPPKYTLLISLPHAGAQRHQEHLNCLEDNLKLDAIERVIVFYEGKQTIELSSSKLTILKTENRPTYQTFLDHASAQFPGKRCIIANADIVFNETLERLNGTDLQGKWIALTRWDEQRDGSLVFYDNCFSQDAWIFQSPAPINDAHFYLGVLTCDNLIAYVARTNGLEIFNPAHDIVIAHRHLFAMRTSTWEDACVPRDSEMFASCPFTDIP